MAVLETKAKAEFSAFSSLSFSNHSFFSVCANCAEKKNTRTFPYVACESQKRGEGREKRAPAVFFGSLCLVSVDSYVCNMFFSPSSSSVAAISSRLTCTMIYAATLDKNSRNSILSRPIFGPETASDVVSEALMQTLRVSK